MSKQVKKSQICQGLAGPGMTVMYDIDQLIFFEDLACAFLQLAAATFADIGGYYFDLSQDRDD